jgi:hypothetical protein
MSREPNDHERQARISRIRSEIRQIGDRMDSLQRILPTIADAETKRKIEQLIESCRLYANHLTERIRNENPS